MLGNNFFVYIEKYFSKESQYQIDRLVKFVNNMGCVGETPVIEIYKKRLKHLIDVQLLIKARSWEEKKPFLVSFKSF